MERLPWQRLLGGIDLLALTLAAYLGAGLWWQLVAERLAVLEPPPVAAQAQPVKGPGAATPSSSPDLGIILQRNLFKTGGAVAPVSEQAQIDALAATSLNLQLLGTVAVAGANGRVEPWAVILDKASGRQDVYRQGDTVAQATVRKILRAKVVLGVQGRDEVLAMEGGPVGGKAAAGGAGGGNRIVLNRQELQGAMDNMSSILSQVDIKPVTGDNGAASGFAVDRIAGGSLFDKLGLRNGDVIQGANGKAVTTPEDAFAIYQGLKSQPNISISILRDGKPETMELHVQ